MNEERTAEKDALAEKIYLASDSYEDDGIEWGNQFGSPRREAERQAEVVAAAGNLCRADGLGVAALLLSRVVDYWDGRPVEHHGHHIYADLVDVLRAIRADEDHNRTVVGETP